MEANGIFPPPSRTGNRCLQRHVSELALAAQHRGKQHAGCGGPHDCGSGWPVALVWRLGGVVFDG